MHWRQMMESEWLGAWDLMDEEGEGRDVVVTIDRVEQGKVTNESKREQRKPVVYFKGKKKPLALNVTNCKTIARLYGNDIRQWSGKAVTLYVGEASVGGEIRPAIRVRPNEPRAKANGSKAAAPPADAPAAGDRQPGEEG